MEKKERRRFQVDDPGNLQFINIADVAECPAGERLLIQIDNLEVLLVNADGEFFAIADYCSHDGQPLDEGEIEASEITCPRHGARFNLQTGEAVSLPAVERIPAYPVRVRDGVIQIGLPREGENIE